MIKYIDIWLCLAAAFATAFFLENIIRLMIGFPVIPENAFVFDALITYPALYFICEAALYVYEKWASTRKSH